MKKLAVFIDAGYFWVQICNTLAGIYNSRAQVTVDYFALHRQLMSEISIQFPRVDLLRVYWYDGPGSSGKTAEHLAIDGLDDFKLRLGTRNGIGQQKGVDGLIIADLISLTQQKAITHAMLVSGDADTAPGVVAAQSMGLRVHLLSIGAAAATSPYLAAEVDMKRSWGMPEISTFATQTAISVAATAVPINSAMPGVATAQAVPNLTTIAQTTHAQLSTGHLASFLAGMSPTDFNIPQEVDRALLSSALTEFGRKLTDTERRELRTAFRNLIKLGQPK